MLHGHGYTNMDMTCRHMTFLKIHVCHVFGRLQLHDWSIRATHGGTNTLNVESCRVGHQYFDFYVFSEFVSCRHVYLCNMGIWVYKDNGTHLLMV